MKRKMWWLKRSSSPHLCARYLMLFCALGVIFLPTSHVWANPAGEQVVGGAATFQRDGNKLTVNQATDRLAVNWQSFNIGAGESTHFNMPSSTSAALNRVIGGNPSSIYGSLSANGILYLINPSGILVGPGGTVNAASFMASTLDVSTEQFMNAKNGAGMNFYGSSGESIINQGNITAEKGDVFLVAQKVENRGTINAANGTAGMVGSGQNTDVMVHEVGGKGFAIRVAQLQGEAATGSNRDLPDGEELLNEGTISAAQAELNASGNVYALAIRNSGTIRAKAVVANADGTVRLDGGLGDVMNTGRMYAKNAGDDATAAGGKIDVAGQNVTASPESIITAAGGERGGNGGSVKIDSQDTTIVQGKVDVTAPSAGAKGGKAQLLGERVGLLDGASVDASGGAAGGTVLVGGDYLGGQTPSADLKNLAKQEAESVKNAKATVMADTAEIKADATVNGDGGKVILWSDEYTGFFGDLFARGGVSGGNGGFIETSSKDNLQAMGAGIASAANGNGGLWLLDPSNLVISSSVSSGGSFNSGNPNVFTPDGTANTAVVNNATIQNSLNAGTDVTLLTSGAASGAGDITMTAGISKDATVSGTASTLTMIAAGSINISQAIVTTDGGLSLVLGAQSGVTIGANIATLGGNLTIQGANAGGASLTASTTTVTMNSGTVSTLGGSGAGNLSITATGAVNQAGGTLLIKGTSSITTGGAAITLTQAANDFTGAVSLNNTGANNVAVTDANTLILGTSSIAGGNFAVITGAGAVTGGLTQSTGALTVGGTTTLTSSAAATDIDLSTQANNLTGSVTIGGTASNVRDFKLRNTSATVGAVVNLGNSTTTSLRDLTITYNSAAYQVPTFTTVTSLRNIAITAGGAITQAAGGIVQGLSATTASFTTGSFGITLTQAANNFIGAVSLNNSGGNAVEVTDANAIIFGTSSVGTGTLTVNAVGITQQSDTRITQSSAAGLVTLNAGAGEIGLTGSFNDFTGNVILSNSGANNVAVTDANSLTLGTSTVGSGTLTVTATQNISQTGTITQVAGAGLASFNTGAGSITLTQANSLTGAVSLNNSATYDATLVNTTGLTLGSSSVGGNYSVTANTGNITDIGGIIVAGTSAFNANAAGATITLDSLGNAFTGAVTFAGSGGLGNVAVVNSTGLVLGASTFGGDLAATFASLSQTGAINVTGTTTLTPSVLGADIDLSTQANNLNGVLTVANLSNVRDFKLRNTSSGATAPNVAGMDNLRDLTLIFNNAPLEFLANLQSDSVRDVALTASSLILGGATGSGTYDVTALAGNITQRGSLEITGDSSFTAPGTFNITLTDSGNRFTGGVRFLSSGSLGNISVVDTTAFDIQSGLSITGNLFLSANGITQSGAMTIGGTTNLNGGSGAVTLPLTGNSYTGNVTISGGSGADLFVLEADDAKLVSVTVDGIFTLRSTSGVEFELGAPGGTTGVFDITNTQLSQFTVGTLSLVANAANISNSTVFNFSGIENLSLTTIVSGNISLTGALTTGNLNMTAAGGSIAASNVANDISGAINASTTGASSITLADVDDITLGVISTGSGAVAITFGKNILTNAGLNLEGRIVTTGTLGLTPTVAGTDIILGASAGNANSIGSTVTINNNANVRDFVLRNTSDIGTAAVGAVGTIVGLASAANLRDVSINYPGNTAVVGSGSYTLPTFASSSIRDISVYAKAITIGGQVTSLNGSIELYQADSLGTFVLANNVNTLAGDIRILSDGGLTVDASVRSVVIGGQTKGAITLSADAGGLGAGTLTLTGTATVGNAQNSSMITLQSADVNFSTTSSILQGAGTVVLKPSTLDADIFLGTAGPAGTFSIVGTELGRIFSSGIVQVGGESQVGDTNIGTLSLTANTFSTLKLVGSSASSALLGANTSWRTFGIGLDFDINVDLDDYLLVIDTTQAGFYPIGADIRFGKQVDSDRTLTNSDGTISLTAGTAGNVNFVGTVGGINPVQFLQVTSGNEVTVGRVTARVGGVNGPGGLVSLTGNTVTVNGVLNVDAITTAAGPGEAGGQVLITGKDVILNNRVTANGGDGVVNAAGANFGGGSAGEIDIRATDSLSVNPTPDAEIGGSFSALGGDPSGGNAGFGADGIIQLASDRDLYFTTNQEAERETQYNISAGRDLIFASFPEQLVGGVSFRMNVNNTEVSRVNLNLAFAQSDSAGILYMAPGSTIQMNGGTLSVNQDQNLTTGRIEFANIDVVNSPSFGLTYTGTSQLKFSGSISGSNTQGGNGAVVSISASNADFVVEGGITVNGDDGAGGVAGNVSVTAKSIKIGEIQANGGGGSGGAGKGGTIDLVTTTGGIEVGSIFGQGGIEDTVAGSGGFGGSGGSVTLRPGGLLDAVRGALDIQTINVSGGACADLLGVGGSGGIITIEASQNLLIPSNMFVGGGDGDQTRGAPGDISITTTGSADIALKESNLVISGTGNLTLNSARNLILGTVDFGADVPLNTISAGSLTLNDGAVAGDTLGELVVKYGLLDATGQLLMPSSSTIDSNGGSVTVTGLGGQAQVGSIFTILADAAGGAININTGGGLLMAGGFLFTQGSDAAAGGNQGLAGGSITLQGSSVSVGSINTSAGGSSSTARLFGRGGQGGNVSIAATGVGGQITLQDDLILTGGRGLSTRDGIGGSGGRINLTGNVVIDSGSSLETQITLNTAGGTGLAAGGSGSGGDIVFGGSLTGTATTSNTLLLSHGSGAVTLGAVTLSELITADATGVAADSTGAVTINGALNLTTLTTQGFGYSLSILGGGSIANRVTFLNTGTTRIGAAGVTTTFTDGFDALTGTTIPSTLQLGGTINTVTETTGSMLASTTQLIADTTLNSAGNSMEFGSLDGTYNLTLAAGVAKGTATFNDAVGDITEVGQITVTGGIDNQKVTLANFLSTVKATGITSGVNSNLTFNNDVTLNNPALGITTDLGGTITFNNQAYLDDLTATLSFLGSGNKRISGATTLSGGPIEFGGLGNYTVSGAINGAQKLTLSDLGTKTFTGIVGGTTALGSVTGGEEAIVISGGDVTFGALTTVNGIVSADAKVTFSGVTTLGFIDKNSVLAYDVDLLGATLTSAGTVDLGDSVAVSVKLNGTVVVNGAGAVNVKGAVTDNAGFTSFTQTGTAGKISFDEDVTLDVAAGVVTLNGNVGLSGMTFDAAGAVTLGDALTDSITLTTAAVTLTGTGTFAVNGVIVGGGQNLTLSGTGAKTFAGGMSDLGTLALTAGSGTFNKTVSGVVFNQSGGVVVMNGNGTFTGASTLGGTSTTLNGITFSSGTTEVTGTLTSTEATTITGGLITLNTALAVTSSSGVLTVGSAVSLGQGTTLSGGGAYKLSGTVNGANSLTLSGGGAKTFSGAVGNGTALSTITQNDASGLVTFAENVTMSGVGAFNANLVLDGLTMTSTGSTLTFGNAGTDTAVISGATIISAGQDITLNSATTLNAALSMTDGGLARTTTLSGSVTGKKSNLTITTDNLTVGNTVQTGSGVVSLVKKNGGTALIVGGAPGVGVFLDSLGISKISTSGGLTVATEGDITINQLLLGDTDQITGAFRMVTSGGNINVAQPVQLNVFSGSAAGALTATGSLSTLLTTQGFQDVVLGVGGLSYDGTSSMNLSRIQVAGDILVSSADAMTVSGSVISGTGNVALGSLNSNLNVAGAVTSAGLINLGAAGDVQISSRITGPTSAVVESGRYFINSYSGNPFESADTRISTTDLFGATWPSNGAVPGLQVVYGVNNIGQVGANQIGVSTTLLAGNAAPYILEFTTGTGQPYIFAQQAAIPPVMLPAALTGGNGFAKTISYSADEIEMMTPEERSTYENQQRQISARVILQGESGEGEEIGAPTEGRTPQAASPAILVPVAPTAQVLLEGKPLAGAKTDQERGDATKIIKIRPTRAVALRSGLNVREVLESERMAAEVSVGAAPVAQSR